MAAWLAGPSQPVRQAAAEEADQEDEARCADTVRVPNVSFLFSGLVWVCVCHQFTVVCVSVCGSLLNINLNCVIFGNEHVSLGIEKRLFSVWRLSAGAPQAYV